MYVYIYKQWCISFHPFLRIRIFINGGIIVEAQFTAFIEPPSAFLILRRRSGMESMRLCKRDKSTSSHSLRIAFFIPSSVVNFLLSSLSSRMAQRFSIGLMSSPVVGHSSTTATSCLSNQVLVDFAVWQVPCLVAVPTHPFRPRTTLSQPAAASSPKCLGMRVRRECLHRKPSQSCPAS